jgi:hypothetical protein
MNKAVHISNTISIMLSLIEEKDDAIDAGDLEYAHECLTAAVECAKLITDRLGPEWFTDDEIKMIENLFVEYALNG